MFSTYDPKDVTILLKDITGMVTPLCTQEREKRIQSGAHYSQMLPLEYEPSEEYLRTFYVANARYARMTANAVASTAQQIWQQRQGEPVLVSLARAGTPVGILIKRYIRQKYGADIPHYTISIIRGIGIDQNAMRYILARHGSQQIQFVDGWTGKGAIQAQMNDAMRDFAGVSPSLAVLSDPARVAGICGTSDDFLIASSLLNATVSGLLSRTFLREDIIGPQDFHGAHFYANLKDQDLTHFFINSVQKHFDLGDVEPERQSKDRGSGLREVARIQELFDIPDINFVKPSIGEATRVLLRRVPWKILVRSLKDEEHLGHLYQLAREKGVAVEEYPLQNYRACGIIRALADT